MPPSLLIRIPFLYSYAHTPLYAFLFFFSASQAHNSGYKLPRNTYVVGIIPGSLIPSRFVFPPLPLPPPPARVGSGWRIPFQSTD
ncbi:hypothetical protein F4775DRAFT_540507 [Biscogniauxia sp. FL1348]|nr:hypothetical protein F4775DRAFT_540507 [Biscogniauxia sp. FL1348]